MYERPDAEAERLGHCASNPEDGTGRMPMLKAARVRRSNFYRYAIAVLAFAARQPIHVPLGSLRRISHSLLHILARPVRQHRARDKVEEIIGAWRERRLVDDPAECRH